MSIEEIKGGSLRRIVTTVLAVVAGLLLLVAGWLTYLAADLRWGEKCIGRDFDNLPCVLAQDHQYDYLLPTDPWVPIPGAAELAGLAYLLVAIAVTLLFATMRSPVWSRCVQVVVVGGYVLVGVTTIMSGLQGSPAEPLAWAATPIMAVWMFGAPFALAFVVIPWFSHPKFDGPFPPAAWLVCLGALASATPLWLFFVASVVVLYSSHDTAPWSEAVGGGLFAIAGLAILVGLAWKAVRPRKSLVGNRPVAGSAQ